MSDHSVYNRLLLSEGGGIIPESVKAEQGECASLFIGLGGTGIDCLRAVKRAVVTRLRPDNPGAAKPAYSHIRFLAVDSDVDYMRRRTDDSVGAIDVSDELFDISLGSWPTDLAEAAWKAEVAEIPKNPAYREWLQYDKLSVHASPSPAAIRQVGRFLLMRKLRNLPSKFEKRRMPRWLG